MQIRKSNLSKIDRKQNLWYNIYIENKGIENMNIKQLAEKLEVSEHYIQHHFPRIQESYKKRGILLIKIGKGRTAEYGMRKTNDCRVIF